MGDCAQRDFVSMSKLPWLLVQIRRRAGAWNCRGCPSRNPGVQPGCERADDLARDLVLDGEDVGEIAVIATRPDVQARQSVDQLDGDAHAVVVLAHTAFDDVAHPQLPSHLGDVYRAVLVDEGRVACDHRQAGNAREVGDQILGQPIGEVLLHGICAQVVERQNRDRIPARNSKVDGDAVCPDRPSNVLHVLFAAILEPHGRELVLHLLVHRGRHADSARLRQRLQAGGDVHPVTVDVSGLHDHVAEVEADPEGQPQVGRHGAIARSHATLDMNRARDRIDRTGELDEDAVSGRLDDPAGVLGHRGIDQLAPMRRQRRQRAVFVRAHEPAEARDVSHQDDT